MPASLSKPIFSSATSLAGAGIVRKTPSTLPLPVLAAVPTLTITSEVIPDVRSTSVVSQTGNITAGGGSAITERGFEYDVDSGAPYASSVHDHVNSTGSYSLDITSLSADTTYYVRAYATNTDGTGYSAETTFHTAPADCSFRDAMNPKNGT